MFRFVIPFLLAAFFSSPAHALTADTGMFDGLEFAAGTQIEGTQGGTLSLCHKTRDLRILGFTVSRHIVGYALANNDCTRGTVRALNKVQMESAQSFGLIDPDLPSEPVNDLETMLRNSAIWVAISLGLVAVIIRRTKSLFGVDLRRPMRRKASKRILEVMCYVGKCDGIVASKEIALISRTAQRYTRRTVKPSEVIRITDHISMDLTPQDFIDFGKGLLDSEKDVLMQGAFYVALASGRLLPAEHDFLTKLAYGTGMPGEDFRRVMNKTLLDLDLNPPV